MSRDNNTLPKLWYLPLGSSLRVERQTADDDFWNKMTTCYDHMTTTRVVSYDPVTTTGVVSYDPVTATAVVSYD